MHLLMKFRNFKIITVGVAIVFEIAFTDINQEKEAEEIDGNRAVVMADGGSIDVVYSCEVGGWIIPAKS